MAAKVETVRVSADTGGGTQDIKISGFGTVKGFLVYLGLPTADGIIDNGTVGFGGSNLAYEFATSVFCEHNVGSTYNRRSNRDDRIIYLGNGSGIVADAYYDSLVTDGIRIQWASSPSAAYLLTFVFFGGSDVSCWAGYANSSNTHIETVGFESDLVITGTTGSGPPKTNDVHSILTIGAALNDTTITERLIGWSSGSGQSSENPSAIVDKNDSSTQVFGGTQSWASNITNFDPDGFNVSVGGDGYVYLFAIKIDNHDIWLGDLDSPTSTGNKPTTNPGFKPQFVMGFPNLVDTDDTVQTNDNANVFGITAFDASNEYSNTLTVDDGAGTTDTSSIAEDKAVYFVAPNAGGSSITLDASFVSMDTNGWTLNWTTVDSTARKFWYIAIEESGAAPATKIRNPLAGPLGGPLTGVL